MTSGWGITLHGYYGCLLPVILSMHMTAASLLHDLVPSCASSVYSILNSILTFSTCSIVKNLTAVAEYSPALSSTSFPTSRPTASIVFVARAVSKHYR